MASSLYKSTENAGNIRSAANSTPPPNYLLCNGAGLSTAIYAALFKRIGYSYGGSGGTFYIPDLRGATTIGEGTGIYAGATAHSRSATIVGSEVHTLITGELPAHSHNTGATVTGGNRSMGSQSAYHYHKNYHDHDFPHSHQYNMASAFGGDTNTDHQRYNNSLTLTATGNATGPTGGATSVTFNSQSSFHTHPVQSSGSGGAHNTMQPSIVVNWLIRY